MTEFVIGVFKTKEDVENTISALSAVGFNPKEMSLVMKDKKEAGRTGGSTATEVSESAYAGATSGAVVGSVAGLLAATMIPSMSGLFVAGPLGAVLGFSGAAVATLSGAVTGAIAGGIVGVLTGLGLSYEEAKVYETYISKGSIMLVVPSSKEEIVSVIAMFRRFHAADTKVLANRNDNEFPDNTPSNQHIKDNSFLEDPELSQALSGMKGGSKDEDKNEDIY